MKYAVVAIGAEVVPDGVYLFETRDGAYEWAAEKLVQAKVIKTVLTGYEYEGQVCDAFDAVSRYSIEQLGLCESLSVMEVRES